MVAEVLFKVLSFIDAPWYHVILEVILLIWVIWLLRKKKKSESRRIVLTKEEEEEIIKAWKPQPLVEEDLVTEESYHPTFWSTVEGRPGKYLQVEGVKYLNLATHNYLGFVDEESLINEAETCIRKYGVGSCGPRGFYGTFDVHIKLEEAIAEFMNLEETALYSYGFATIASAIPSYAKNGDIVFADEFVNFSIQKGLQASRSTIKYFKHNDYADLERLLDEQLKQDLKNPKKAKTQKRFCVVEGIYAKTGTMCPLIEINQLCLQHKVRLFVDESISFGVLGETGRGITEHLSVPVRDIDFISGTMEYAFACYGGFVVGSSYVVDHQRISGLGYCFSASLPPMLAGAGLHALKLIQENPHFISQLQANCSYMHKALKAVIGFDLEGNELSPLKFLSLSQSTGSRQLDHKILDDVILYVKDNFKIALTQPALLENEEYRLPPACIRISVNRQLSEKEMSSVALALQEASNVLELQS